MTPDPARNDVNDAPDPGALFIVNYPHPALRARTRKVEPGDPGVRAVAERMIELMREAEGIGLAAPQVGLSWRMFVIDIPHREGGRPKAQPDDDRAESTGGPIVFINPRIHDAEGAPEPMEEGCLSLPDINGELLRPPRIAVTATDLEGREFTIKARGLLARCLQHEFDHLEGVLIIDRFTRAAELKNRKAVKSLEQTG